MRRVDSEKYSNILSFLQKIFSADRIFFDKEVNISCLHLNVCVCVHKLYHKRRRGHTINTQKIHKHSFTCNYYRRKWDGECYMWRDGERVEGEKWGVVGSIIIIESRKLLITSFIFILSSQDRTKKNFNKKIDKVLKMFVHLHI